MLDIIFLLDSTYPEYTGGRETWINHICNILCQDANITVITEMAYDGCQEYGKFENVDPKIKLIRAKTLKNIRFIKPFLRSYLGYLGQVYARCSMERQLRALLRRKEHAIVISMDTVFMATIPRRLKRRFPNIVHIASSRGPHAELTALRYPLLKHKIMKDELKNLQEADAIWANGYDTEAALKSKGFSSVVIKNGVNTNYTCEGKPVPPIMQIDEPKIVTIGSVMPIKGYDELIRAIKIVHEAYNMPVHLFALGKGNTDIYVQLAKQLQIDNYVHFLGEVRDTIYYAQHADIVACLSGGSGFSMACLEAMVSKSPIIAWDTPVYQQLFMHRVSGYLVEHNNIEKLAEGILWMLLHPSEARAFGSLAYETAKKHDWETVIEDIKKQLNYVTGASE